MSLEVKGDVKLSDCNRNGNGNSKISNKLSSERRAKIHLKKLYPDNAKKNLKISLLRKFIILTKKDDLS